MSGVVFYIPEATAITPAEGHAIVGRWWTVHPEKGLAFFTYRKRPYGMEPGEEDEPSPQCNSDRFTADHLQKKLYPDCETRQIPVVFMRHAVREMHRIRKELAAERAALTTTERG